MIAKWFSRARREPKPPAPPKPAFTRGQAAYASFQIGKHTYGEPRVLRWPGQEHSSLTIGSHTSIAHDVTIFLGGEHRTDWVTTYPFREILFPDDAIPTIGKTKGSVHIGHDVWIGHGASILSGVSVGDGAIVGAMSVVARDVPPYAIVVGNPARIVRQRFPEPVIERLLRVRWWDWTDERLREHLPLLLSDDVERFLRAAEATK